MAEPLARLTRDIEVHVADAIIDVYNALEGYAACAGIKDDPENAQKAILNHYGHPGLKGSWVPARTYITNAVSDGGGEHRRMPDADVALRSVIMKEFQNSVRRQQDTSVGYKSTGSNKAFGTTNSPNAVLKKVAAQMYENQMTAMDEVLPPNTDWTLKKKKKRSDKPLIDYGDMKRATRYWVEHDEEEEDAE